MHNILKGRRKAVWVSASTLLECGARNELVRLGFKGSTPTLDTLQDCEEGVLFLTYSSLGSSLNSSSLSQIDDKRFDSEEMKRELETTGIKRFHQLLKWLGPGFEGVVRQMFARIDVPR